MKRFYKEVSVAQADAGWQVLLDGRGIRTAGRRAQAVPTQALVERSRAARRPRDPQPLWRLPRQMMTAMTSPTAYAKRYFRATSPQ